MWYHRRKDKWKDKCRETTGTRGIMAHGSIHVLSTVPEGEEKREMEKNAWRKQLAQIWCKYKQIWVQTQIRINKKKTNTQTLIHIIVTLLKTRYKEKILNAVRGKKDIVKYKDITDSTDESEQEQMSLSKLREMMKDREAQRAAVRGVVKSRTWLSNNKVQRSKDKNDNRLLLRNYASHKSMKHHL